MGVAASRAMPLLLGMLALAGPITAQTRAAAIDAHPIGAPVTTIIEFGEQYLGSEQYDAKITVLEVLRGEKAREIVKRANAADPVPKSGFDYLLARVRFEFAARTSLAHHSYDVDVSQFRATSRDGRDFSVPVVVTPPTPVLKGTLKSGDSLEGWLAFSVPRSVPKPLMVFHEDVGDVSHVGSGTWFELYKRAPTAPPPK